MPRRSIDYSTPGFINVIDKKTGKYVEALLDLTEDFDRAFMKAYRRLLDEAFPHRVNPGDIAEGLPGADRVQGGRA